MRNAMLSIASGVALLAASAASAEAWDEGHMRSRYRSLLETPTPAVEVRGADR